MSNRKYLCTALTRCKSHLVWIVKSSAKIDPLKAIELSHTGAGYNLSPLLHPTDLKLNRSLTNFEMEMIGGMVDFLEKIGDIKPLTTFGQITKLECGRDWIKMHVKTKFGIVIIRIDTNGYNTNSFITNSIISANKILIMETINEVIDKMRLNDISVTCNAVSTSDVTEDRQHIATSGDEFITCDESHDTHLKTIKTHLSSLATRRLINMAKLSLTSSSSHVDLFYKFGARTWRVSHFSGCSLTAGLKFSNGKDVVLINSLHSHNTNKMNLIDLLSINVRIISGSEALSLIHI